MSSSSIRQSIVIVVAVGCALGQSAGTFTATGSMTTAREGHTATLLVDGRVLIAGGAGDASAEIYDPATGAFTATGSMSTPRYGATATLLGDGRVLMVGGNPAPGPALQSAELYDPASGVFTGAGNLTYPRTGHTAIRLASGKVLIVGGYDTFGEDVAVAELYDPDTGNFTPTASFAQNTGCDFCPPSVLLADGRTLFSATNPAQLYDPATASFSMTGAQPYDAWGVIDYHNAATLLMNGEVLLAGGEDDFGRKSSAELYGASTGAFSATGSLLSPRSGHSLTLLPDRKALAAGGETDTCTGGLCIFAGTLATAELYDPASGAFTATASMTAAREDHTATLLNDGRILLAGGEAWGGIDVFYGSTAGAELYTPAVLVPAPKLFSMSGDGKGQGAIWQATTGQLASSGAPAIAGEALSMYTTNLTEGGVIPPGVFIGGKSAQILYFGDAPGFPGFNQVNVVVPDGIVPGSAIPVRLIYLGRSSNEVTIAVQ
ncbi:MAG TPA: kelch repeat-containing protein [Bryobacteraceae bacterium]|nr:kelch repeat-containing protein [Bryobacteraceae bacterium]